MTLGDKQAAFTGCMIQFLSWAHLEAERRGLRLVMEEFERHPTAQVPGGHKNSTHLYRLAGHLLLLRRYGSGWRFLRQASHYEWLGEMWESLHPLARWGGRFGDGIHFSFEHNGVR